MTTRWLSEDEQRSWRAYLRGSRLLEAVLDRDLNAAGVQLPEYEVLSMLSEAPRERMRMSAIADLVVQSRSRLTHAAIRLERRGWVRRESCLQDRRGVELVLTSAGRRAVEQIARQHVASVRRHLVDHLEPEELAALGSAMSHVADGIAREGGCSGAAEGGCDAETVSDIAG